MGNLKYSDKTPIKEGDYFIALMSDDYDRYNPLVKLKLDTESKTIELREIVLEKSYNTEICNNGVLPIIFRYMGNDEVFELITERKIPIMYDNDEFDEFNIFENNSSSYIIRCDKRNCNGICPIAYFICDIADTWRRKSPSHRKYNRTGFCPWFTVECRQRTFSRSYGIRTHKHGNR